MGRSTSGVIGMRFRDGDELLAMDTVRPAVHLVTVTEEGYAKRTDLGEWTPRAAVVWGCGPCRLVEERGSLVARDGLRYPVDLDLRDRQQRGGHPDPGRRRPADRPGTRA